MKPGPSRPSALTDAWDDVTANHLRRPLPIIFSMASSHCDRVRRPADAASCQWQLAHSLRNASVDPAGAPAANRATLKTVDQNTGCQDTRFPPHWGRTVRSAKSSGL
jgi:hypothetical protein